MNKSEKPEKSEDITFEEFKEMCTEAGITTDNLSMLEADYRAGRALADVTDALISDLEAHAEKYGEGDHIEAMDSAIVMLAESDTIEGAKKMATKLAVHALRYLAEHCHDEGQN